jgi:hypothetical protein
MRLTGFLTEGMGGSLLHLASSACGYRLICAFQCSISRLGVAVVKMRMVHAALNPGQDIMC